MDRETAHAFARERCSKESTYRRLISVEGVMRSFARWLGEDRDTRGLTGPFPDLDQDHTGDDGARHALVRPERATGIQVSSVKKKRKERSFAPGVHRAEITGAEESIGLPLDAFIAISIEGLREVAPEVDLLPGR